MVTKYLNIKISGWILLVAGAILLLSSPAPELSVSDTGELVPESGLLSSRGERSGTSFLLLGSLMLITLLKGVDTFKTPSNKIWIVVLGGVAVILTNIGYIIHSVLVLSTSPNADSLTGTGMMFASPIVFVIAVLWYGANMFGLSKDMYLDQPLFPLRLLKGHWWYAFVIFSTVVMIMLTSICGFYWYLPAELVWLYFYASMMKGLHMPEGSSAPEAA